MLRSRVRKESGKQVGEGAGACAGHPDGIYSRSLVPLLAAFRCHSAKLSTDAVDLDLEARSFCDRSCFLVLILCWCKGAVVTANNAARAARRGQISLPAPRNLTWG